MSAAEQRSGKEEAPRSYEGREGVRHFASSFALDASRLKFRAGCRSNHRPLRLLPHASEKEVNR